MSDTPAKHFGSRIDLYRKLRMVWSAETASLPESWSAENAAKNHCNVTVLIVQDHFGENILNTKTVGETHIYKLIDGTRWDLTVSQFAEPIPFEDNLSSRNAAMQDTTHKKYQAVTLRFRVRL